MKQILFLFLIITLASCNHMQSHLKDEPKKASVVSSGLKDTIASLDSTFFSAFNAHDTTAVAEFLTEDLEFYHDEGGFSNYAQNLENFKKLFKNVPDIKRELVPGTLEVWPIKDFGAIQTASHKFCHLENGKQDCGTFKFMHIWKNVNGKWKIARIISYDH